MPEIHVNPKIREAEGILKKALARKEVIVIVGSLSIDYVGRSRSRLTHGERIVLIKPDGSILVHRPTGYKPVNWQPDSKIIEVFTHDSEVLVIRSIRGKPREILTMYFDNVKMIYTDKLVDHGEFAMYIDEHEIRDLLYEHPEIIEDGLRIIEKEKPLRNGYIDLFGVDSRGKPVIIELKRVTATREAVLQLYNYVVEYEKTTGVKPRGILVAPSFSAKAVESLSKLGLERREISLQKLWREYLKPSQTPSKTHSLMDYLGKSGEE